MDSLVREILLYEPPFPSIYSFYIDLSTVRRLFAKYRITHSPVIVYAQESLVCHVHYYKHSATLLATAQTLLN
jgi:hypothetical protein